MTLVANPVEGTMLTVVKEWSDYIYSNKESISDFEKVIIDSSSVLEKSLSETTFRLKELSNSGYVDAGAKGFVLFIRGIIDFIKNRNIRNLEVDSLQITSLIHSEKITEEEITQRYCTEAIIKNVKVEKNELKKILAASGISVIVGGSEKVSRIHVHTNTPAELFHQLKDIGTITYQKVDDMIRQQESAVRREMEHCACHRFYM